MNAHEPQLLANFLAKTVPRVLLALIIFIFLVRTIYLGPYVGYLATRDPIAALEIDPDNAAALVVRAEQLLSETLKGSVGAPALGSETPVAEVAQPEAVPDRFSLGRGLAKIQLPGEPLAGASQLGETIHPSISENALKEIEAYSTRAIKSAPLNVRALTLLGTVAELRGDTEKAFKILSHAARLSPRARAAHFWLLDYNLKAQNFEDAAKNIDVLMRTSLQAQKLVVPVLARMANSNSASIHVQKLISADPPWRRRFLSAPELYAANERVPLQLFLLLRDAGHTVDPLDLKPYLDHLVKSGSTQFAYYVWLQFLTPEQLSKVGLLYDPDFGQIRTTLPFDWNVGRGNGFTTDLAAGNSASTQGSITVTFSGSRVEGLHISQRLMLPEGSYEFTYEYQGDLSGRRGLVWRLRCASTSTKLLSEAPMFIGHERTWRAISVAIDIPAESCSSQMIQLTHDARTPSERVATGLVQYRGLRLTRKAPSTN